MNIASRMARFKLRIQIVTVGCTANFLIVAPYAEEVPNDYSYAKLFMAAVH